MHMDDSTDCGIVTLFLILCPLLICNHQALEPSMLNGIFSVQKIQHYVYCMFKVPAVLERGDSSVTQLVVYLLISPGLEHDSHTIDTGSDQHKNDSEVDLSELQQVNQEHGDERPSLDHFEKQVDFIKGTFIVHTRYGCAKEMECAVG